MQRMGSVALTLATVVFSPSCSPQGRAPTAKQLLESSCKTCGGSCDSSDDCTTKAAMSLLAGDLTEDQLATIFQEAWRTSEPIYEDLPPYEPSNWLEFSKGSLKAKLADDRALALRLSIAQRMCKMLGEITPALKVEHVAFRLPFRREK